MSQKIIKYHYIMNFNFIFISYSVIYAKYNYCYEVPREQPLRYFDGKEWKLMKPRHNIRTKAPRNSSILVDLDWAELIKEVKEFELEETTTEMPKCSVFISDTTAATKKATTERLNTKRETSKKFTTKRKNTNKLTFKIENAKKTKTVTTKKITTKVTASPKVTVRLLATQSNAKVKPILNRCRPLCMLKSKSPTTTVDPRLLPLKMTTSRDWRDNWNLLRPTKKHSPVTVNKLALKATKAFVQMMKKVLVTTTRKSTPTTKSRLPTTRKSTVTRTTKKPVKSTKKPTARTTATVAVIKLPQMTPEMPEKYAGYQADDASSPANWSNLLKEFLKFVESKKCQRPPCESATAITTKPYPGYQLAQNEDDLMSIMMDGVEIDERRDEEDEDATRIKDTLDYEGRRLNYESAEGFVSGNSEMRNDYVQDLDFESLRDSIETRRDTALFPKKMGYLKQYQAENEKKVPLSTHIIEPDLYLDKFKDNNFDDDDDFLENEIKSHSDELEANLAGKENFTSQIRESEADLDESKERYIAKNEGEFVENIEKKAYSDALKDMRANKNYIFSGIKRSEALKTSQNRKAKSFFDALTEKHSTKKLLFSEIREPIYLHQDKIKDQIVRKEDEVLQASDINFHSDPIMGKIEEKGYATSRYRKTEIDTNELSVQEDKVIDDSEIKFYINALKNKHAKKETEPSAVVQKRKQYIGEENGQQDKLNLQEKSAETFNSKELNEITDYIASEPAYPVKIGGQTINVDGLQNSDISFD